MTERQRQLDSLFMEMIRFDAADPHRIQHFTKVHAYARLIAEMEDVPEDVLFTLEAAAYVHDIGIRLAMERYGFQNGSLQEQLGPPAAEEMLRGLGFGEETVRRVSYLVGHHHTYTDINGVDYQILVEADFLVNLHEKNEKSDAVRSVRERIFRTKTGTEILETMFGI